MARLASLSSWDAAACLRVNSINRKAGFSAIFAIASRLGDGSVWWTLMLVLPLVVPGGLHQSLVMAANGGICTLIYSAIKRTTRRPRPSDVYATLELTVAPLDRFSFPSGHTLHAVAFTTLAWHYHPLLGMALLPFTLLVALSRIVLGLHYPSDVLAGACIGIGGSLTSIALERLATT